MFSPLRNIITLPIVALALSGCVSTLERAVESGDYQAVKQEIARGGNVDGNYWTSIKMPIFRAIANDDLEMVKLLHNNGATISPGSLGTAAQASAVNTYSYLLDNGAELDICITDTNYPGYWTSSLNSIMPPLGSAIIRGNLSSVNLLLDLGAAMEVRCDVALGGDYNYSAILVAAYVGNPYLIELLIRKGSNPNRLSVTGRTPISLAAEYGHYEAARVLLANGAFHTYTTQIKQPIEYAYDNGNQNIVNLLAYAGAVRPQRADPSKVLESIADVVIEGVIFAAEIYVISQGKRYSGYDPTYNRDSSTDSQNISRAAALLMNDGKPVVGDGGCGSDFDVPAGSRCAKYPGFSRGETVRDLEYHWPDLNSMFPGSCSGSYNLVTKKCEN
jgi:ankyrin repeat protein